MILAATLAFAVQMADAKTIWGKVTDYDKWVSPTGLISISFRCKAAFDWCYQKLQDGGWNINHHEGIVYAPNEPVYDPTTDLYTAEIIE